MAVSWERSSPPESAPSSWSGCGFPALCCRPRYSKRLGRCNRHGGWEMTIIITVFITVFASVLLVSYGLQAKSKARRRLTSTRPAAIPVEAGLLAANDMAEDLLRDDALSSVPWLDRLLQKMNTLNQAQTVQPRHGTERIVTEKV